MYGGGLLKGMMVTFRQLLSTPFTVQYPDRRVGLSGAASASGMSPLKFLWRRPSEGMRAIVGMARVEVRNSQSTRFRGQEFTWYEDRCTGCASCAKFCPLGIIRIETHPGGVDVQEGESYAIDVFDIDIGRCMYCGLCVEACPYDALHMGSGFERGQYHRTDLVVPMEELRDAPKRPSTWFRPQLEAMGYDPQERRLDTWRSVGRHEQPSEEELKTKWVDER